MTEQSCPIYVNIVTNPLPSIGIENATKNITVGNKLKVSKPKDDIQQALEKIQKALQEVLMDLSEPRPDVTSTSCCEQRI